MVQTFEREYEKLNPAQKKAVDTIEGPVMVVAGPGTGKTQVLALRIANILKKTDIKADGILCLTFTNSAVDAMRERLIRYIGQAGEQVGIFTFHSFGMRIIEKHFWTLGLEEPPKLIEEADLAIFFDKILHGYDWEYLRPRGDGARYFSDLKSLLSLLKRERITAGEFLSETQKEIKGLAENEQSISTRGENKGELKQEVQKQIEGLERSLEAAKFFEVYEEEKKKQNVLDYDDVLENMVKIAETSEEAAAEIREQYLYVLIDEHQDSSRVQNEFLIRVWGEVERPDIFVVGDDRQLIYGFSGASIDHFRGFKKTFPDARLITLLDNYRSTQVILDAAHALLQSVMSKEKLRSQNSERHPIKLVEASDPEEEILAAGADIAERIKKGADPNGMALLVPKNRQARAALEILHSLRIPVSSLDKLKLFDQEETRAFLRVLNILALGDKPALALSFFDKTSGIPALQAHEFFAGRNMKNFSLESMMEERTPTLFGGEDKVSKWLAKLASWREFAKETDLESLVRRIGEEMFPEDVEGGLVSGKDVVETILELLHKEIAGNPKMSLPDLVSYLHRLESYNDDVPVKTPNREGVKVLTMHSAKGLEFDYVWIAHMDEQSLSGGRSMGFMLPEAVESRVEERDIDAVKRKLYVAITRAKRFCTLSYSTEIRSGQARNVAGIIDDLPKEVFSRRPLGSGPRPHASGQRTQSSNFNELKELAAKKFSDRYISAWLLNNFFECPWKWYFVNFLGLPQPPSENLQFGSMVHSVIERVLERKDAVTEEWLGETVAEAARRAGFENERIKVRAEREAFKIIARFAQDRLPEIKPNRKTEENISVRDKNFPGFSIFGRIDLIENLGPKEVRVTDFKTGKAKRKSEIEKKDEEGRLSSSLRQLVMYSYLLKENPRWQTDARESRLEFLEAKSNKDSIYNTVIGKTEIDLLIKDIKDYEKLIKSGQWTERECHYNSYGKNTECEYCKMAGIYKN